MGITSSDLRPQQSRAGIHPPSSGYKRRKLHIPLYPLRQEAITGKGLKLVPTCDHNMLREYTGRMNPRMQSRAAIPFAGGMPPQRRPAYGYDGWGMRPGPGYGYPRRPDTICGYCGDMAHPGPCYPRDDGDLRRGRGDGMFHFEPGPAFDKLDTAMENAFNVPRGCGPTCSANDGALHLRGTVGHQEVDLKVRGAPKCPCEEHGGCEAHHRRTRSRSRSRRRRERRGRRRMATKEKASSSESSDLDTDRGRTREKKQPQDGKDKDLPSIQPRLDRLEKEVEKLNNGWQYLKDHIADLNQHSAPLEMELPNGTPIAQFRADLRRPSRYGIPFRLHPRRHAQSWDDLCDTNDPNLQPRPRMERYRAGVGRGPNEADDFNLGDDPIETEGIADHISGANASGAGRHLQDPGLNSAGFDRDNVRARRRLHPGMGRGTWNKGFRGRQLRSFSGNGDPRAAKSRIFHGESSATPGAQRRDDEQVGLNESDWEC